MSDYNNLDTENTKVTSIIPERFSIELPSIISGADWDGEDEPGDSFMDVEETFQQICSFVGMSQGIAEMVEEVLDNLRELDIDDYRNFTFVSEYDEREKHGCLRHNVVYERKIWKNELLISDLENDTYAVQIVWNNSPFTGIAVLDVYQITPDDPDYGEEYEEYTKEDIKGLMVRIDYSEAANEQYDATMQVSFSGSMGNQAQDINGLQIFVGNKGDKFEAYGNANFPAMVMDETNENEVPGRNYAFVMRHNETEESSVVSLALPPSACLSSVGIMEEYSFYNIATRMQQNTGSTDEETDNDLEDVPVFPAYFSEGDFISAGDGVPAQEGFNSDFADISSLRPFAPIEISNLKIDWLV